MTVKFYFDGHPEDTYEGVSAGTWNGWAVPILPEAEYQRVKVLVDKDGINDPYEGTKVDGGWLCDGLCWFILNEDEDDY